MAATRLIIFLLSLAVLFNATNSSVRPGEVKYPIPEPTHGGGPMSGGYYPPNGCRICYYYGIAYFCCWVPYPFIGSNAAQDR